jgi:hypothetical protein
MSSSQDEYQGYSIRWDVIFKADKNLFAAQAGIVSHPVALESLPFIPSQAAMILQQRRKLGLHHRGGEKLD